MERRRGVMNSIFLKILKFFIGGILTIGISLGVAALEVWLIPIRGLTLTLIIASTTSFLVVIPGVLLTVAWMVGDER